MQRQINHFYKDLSEPHFTNVCLGKKTIEGRPASGSFGSALVGDIITFYNDISGKRRECTVVITEISHHGSFLKMMKAHTLKKVLPDAATYLEGLKEYSKFYPHLVDPGTLNEKEGNILGITLRLI